MVYEVPLMILGAHEGIAGGVSRAFERAEQDTAEAVQIFVRNPRGWASKPVEEAEVDRFRAEAKRTGMPSAAHSIYLANHASPDPELREKSWGALGDELARCEQLGIAHLVFHPGSNADEKEGLTLVAEGMERALDGVRGASGCSWRSPPARGSRWAGASSTSRPSARRSRPRPGAASASASTPATPSPPATTSPRAEGYEKTFAEFDDVIGLEHLSAFHLNDCKKPLGCRVDRHEHIGQGALGREPFRRLVNDRRFAALPAFLETEMQFRENLKVLRSLLR